MLAKDRQMFPDNPDVWLKDLASFINVELANSDVPISDTVFEGKPPGECHCWLLLILFFGWHTHTHLMALYSGLPGSAGTKRVKPIGIRDFTEARDSECQWHQLGHMQVCNSLQTDNHASTPPLIFLPAGCPSCCPTTSVKTLKAHLDNNII